MWLASISNVILMVSHDHLVMQKKILIIIYIGIFKEEQNSRISDGGFIPLIGGSSLQGAWLRDHSILNLHYLLPTSNLWHHHHKHGDPTSVPTLLNQTPSRHHIHYRHGDAAPNPSPEPINLAFTRQYFCHGHGYPRSVVKTVDRCIANRRYENILY